LSPLGLLLLSVLIPSGCREAEPPRPYTAPEDARIELREDIVFLTASEMARRIRFGVLSSKEVVEAHLSQIHAFNPQLNAIVTIDEGSVRARAEAADAALAKGEIWGPLHGVPVTIKDAYATKGLRTTSGYPPLADHVPDFDAPAVERLRDAGAIILGKTNLPILSTDYQTDNPVFGRTNNPWDLSLTPGGSTGGGSAAVAAGLSPLELGSDLGGSIRLPSHFCGIFGLKPTENRVPKAGYHPGMPEGEFQSVRHMVSNGPLARSVEDLALAFGILAGADPRDVDAPAIPVVFPEPPPLETLRVAWADGFPDLPASREIREAVGLFAARLAEGGLDVAQLHPPDFPFETVWDTYGSLLDMEFGVQTPKFFRLIAYVFRLNPFLVFPYSYEKYLKVLTERDRLVSKTEAFLDDYDVWIIPVSPIEAFEHRAPKTHRGPFPIYEDPVPVDGRPLDYWEAIGSYTVLLNLTGHPAVVVPIGFTEAGLPIGAQIVGARFEEARLLVIAEQLFDLAGSFRHPPGFEDDEQDS
jgi:amidase